VIGIDTGGTFIDLVVFWPDGRVDFHKELVDPADLARSVMRGLARLAHRNGSELGDLLARTATIAHGTTIATNAVLTRTGAPTGLLTTAGLRDALEMRRGVKEEVFDLRYQAPPPLVRRARRYGVEERIGHDGAVLRALAPDAALEQLGAAVAAGEVRSVALCLMHAWRNPDHERALANRLHECWPELPVTCSSEVLCQIGFYDRLSTTVATAYTAPLMASYVAGLERALINAGFAGDLFVISSAGGLLTARDAVAGAARTVLSGPAAAPAAGARLCAAAGVRDAVVVDMGGTSFDVSLVRDLAPVRAPGGEVGGVRIAFPMTDVRTIPLGGGSIAWLDEGGLLRLGPESAGAHPGPACFGRGGTRPTITDADLVLGYLDPNHFAAAELRVDRALAEAALRRDLGERVGGDAPAAAVGVFRLAASQMADAILRAALDGGLDYRRVPLVIGGGAGPVHAAAIGRELGAELLVVPASASTLCAMGALLLQPRYDAVRGLFRRLGDATPRALGEITEALRAELSAACHRPPDQLALTFSADLRYTGQEHTLLAEFSPAEVLESGVGVLRRSFERMHRERYGHVLEAVEIEILGVRATASWELGVRDLPASGHPARRAVTSVRESYDVSTGSFREFAVHSCASLRPRETIRAPALVEMIGSTCVVTDPYLATVDAAGTLMLRHAAQGTG
jgi:N-methylhydantoinase A